MDGLTERRGAQWANFLRGGGLRIFASEEDLFIAINGCKKKGVRGLHGDAWEGGGGKPPSAPPDLLPLV